MADISSVEKKLREAIYFLRKYSDRAAISVGDADELDYLLSAFLSAARAVDYRLRHEAGQSYVKFYQSWEANLAPGDSALMKFIAADRAFEVHENGSQRTEAHDAIPIHGTYRDAACSITVWGPPDVPAATVLRPTREYVIDGQIQNVTQVCRRYLELLSRLLADFSAACP